MSISQPVNVAVKQIGDDLEFIKSQLARLPTRKALAQTALLATLTTAALVLVGFEALFR
jgi:hypothetical protein